MVVSVQYVFFAIVDFVVPTFADDDEEVVSSLGLDPILDTSQHPPSLASLVQQPYHYAENEEHHHSHQFWYPQ